MFARQRLGQWTWCEGYAVALYVPSQTPPGASPWLPVWPLDSHPEGPAYPICEGCCDVLNRQRFHELANRAR